MTSTSHIKWWHDSVFYEIYIASFQDSNDDGIGDFNGLISRLDYLQHLGITGLWITPFYPSPKIDNGYDVSDYYDIDPDFGCMADFDHFIEEAHKRNIKVIIDIVLNHVSTEHIWFKKAISSPHNKYRDYFIFKNKINNWESFFGGSAWQKEPYGKQYYYHKFALEQADLNWQNNAVKDEMSEMLNFWIDKGVDGFRFDVINFLSCAELSNDNSVDRAGKQVHTNDIDQPGIKICIEEICTKARQYSAKNGKICFLVGEIAHEELSKLQPYQTNELFDVVFNFNLGSIPEFDITKIYNQIQEMESSLCGLPTLFFNSHDMARSMSRLCNNDPKQAKALAALVLTLKGIPFLYFGEEIGMPNYEALSVSDLRDISAISHYKLALEDGNTEQQAFDKAKLNCRDKSRLYMQWNDAKYSGFSNTVPWIGHASVDVSSNVKHQINNKDSLWNWYHELIELRSSFDALSVGSYQGLTLEDQLIRISRRYNDEIIYIFINFSNEQKFINYNKSHTILASREFHLDDPDLLLPYGVLIIREI